MIVSSLLHKIIPMGTRKFLGELEQLVLLAVARLGDEAYGMSIRREIAARTNRDVAIGAVYSALDRMERKGHVSAWVGEPTAQPGGRAKRYYRMEPSGRTALKSSLDTISSLLEGLELDPRPERGS